MELNYEVSKSKKQKGKAKHVPGCGECVRYEGYNSILTTSRNESTFLKNPNEMNWGKTKNTDPA